MSKKTSKTSHVLNVLTSHGENDEPDEISDEAETPVNDEAESVQETPVREEPPTPVQEPAAVVPPPAEIAEQIKTKLAEEARAFLEGTLSPSGVVNDIMEKQPENEQNVHEDYEYFYVNILESIVQEKVLLMLKQNNQCMCNTCVNDAIAFALNQLPPKYVVTTKGGLFVQAALYEKQYSVDIISAVAQGCMKVADHPSPSHNPHQSL